MFIKYISFLFLINCFAYSGDFPGVDYNNDKPYLKAKPFVIIEVLSTRKNGKLTYRYFLQGTEFPLPEIINHLKSANSDVPSEIRVMILHEPQIAVEQINFIRKSLSDQQIKKVTFEGKRGLEKALLAYIKRINGKTPVIIFKKNGTSVIEDDFNLISKSLLSLKNPVKDTPDATLVELIADCKLFLKKHINEKNHPFYVQTEKRLAKLVEISKKGDR